MQKDSTGNILLHSCVIMSGLARFPEVKRNVNAMVVDKYFLVGDARKHPDVLDSGKEALALVMCADH